MDHLPNEMLGAILGKIITFNQLINLRLVNKRWQVLIEALLSSYLKFKLKFIKTGTFLFTNKDFDETAINIASLICPDQSHFVIFKLNYARQRALGLKKVTLSADFCALLQRLLPPLESLVIDIEFEVQDVVPLLDQWASKLKMLSLCITIPEKSMSRLCHYINWSLPALKQLALKVNLSSANVSQLAPTLGRLQCFFMSAHSFKVLLIANQHLSSKCTHLWTDNIQTMLSLRKCCLNNLLFWSNLIHLQLEDVKELSVIEELCQYANKLHVLKINCIDSVCNGVVVK